jgi:hypothetical protein
MSIPPFQGLDINMICFAGLYPAFRYFALSGLSVLDNKKIFNSKYQIFLYNKQ